jgi:conjugative relaxase-like TrwC/TraI family protein
MLRITVSTSAAAAQRYYVTGLAKQDYYSEGQEIIGELHGKAAERLKLPRKVTAEVFAALSENRDPATGETLTARQKENRRSGYDFTFCAPKGPSLLFAMTGDERIKTAFETAVQDTMQEIERDMQARVRKDGAAEDRTTGNAVWASFTHYLARPVDGVPDPSLHSHNFMFNATWDPVEHCWKAGQFHDLHINRHYYEAAFHARFAAGMRALGYGIARHGKWWDIEGLPKALLEKFSRRTAEIEATAEAKGITDPDAKGALGAKTRAHKGGELDMDSLRVLWRDRMSTGDHRTLADVLEQANAGGASSGDHTDSPTAEEALRYAVATLFERESVVSERQVLDAALRYGRGFVQPEQLTEALRHAGSSILTATVDGRRLVTTREVLAEEQAMLAFARDGRGTCTPFGLGRPAFHAKGLKPDQEAAVRHVLDSWDRVTLIRGGAGTGKTRLMQAAVPEIERCSGRKVHAFAPSADASRGVLRQEGFVDANTVEHLLRNEVLQQRLKGQILWIDEAGLLGARDMGRVFALADRLGCRVILAGDAGQHGSVNRGDALRLLETQAGLRAANVTEIIRQRGAYKDAVAAIARGETTEGFDRLDRLGWVVEAPDDEARYALMGEDYTRHTRAGKTALVVAPTHQEGERVTAAIRARLRDEGRLGDEERTLFTLRPLHWTEAEKAQAEHYRPGLVVQFEQNAAGVTRGERFQVSRIKDGQVWICARDGREILLPRAQAARFEVYEPTTLVLAAGDRLRVTHNGQSADGHRMDNGALYTVDGFTRQGDLRLSNGWIIGQDYGHLATGFYTTSHASQGKTVDQVLIAQSALSAPVSSREQFYVSVSRGREGVRIYTDDKEALRAQILRSGQRGSATELLERRLAADTQPRALSEQLKAARERLRRRTADHRRRRVSVGLLREWLAQGAERAQQSWQERTRHAGETEQAGPRYER